MEKIGYTKGKLQSGLYSRNPFRIDLIEWKIGDNCLKVTFADGNKYSLLKEGTLEGWVLVWVGKALERQAAVLERTVLDADGYLILLDENEGYYVRKPKIYHVKEGGISYYGGREVEKVLASGRDVLGEEVLQKGEPSYEAVVSLLPPIKTGKYAILGSPTSWGKLIIMPNGDIVTHDTWAACGNVTQLLTISEIHGSLAGITPSQGLLDEWIPIIMSRFMGERELVEITAFVVSGETGRDPATRVRIATYLKGGGTAKSNNIWKLVRSRGKVKRTVVGEHKFYEQFISTMLYWFRFRDRITIPKVPESNVSRWLLGSMAMAATTFSSDHPHYGGRGYASEIHDFFLPNFLTSVEAFFSLGDTVRVRRILEHLLAHGVDETGRFTKWQGSGENFATSGTEYGQFLWLLERIESAIEPQGWIKPYLDTLEKIGYYIVRRRMPTEQAGGRRLVLLCAEADNNDRIYPYLGNNLWAVRGLWGLSRLLRRYDRENTGLSFKKEGDDLLNTVKDALREYQALSPYGPIMPFRFGYPPIPWTLSQIKSCPEGIDSNTFETYLNTWSSSRAIQGSNSLITKEQDFLENTYANYRYYPEALSAMLLEPEQADAIVALRRDRGGEALGMCRFGHGIDEWPGANYARFLLATDRIDAYLLLYYAHMCHHGARDVLTYYEQVTLDGGIMAPDCIPSLLLVPMMTAWMFCFEPVGEDALYLCRATPRYWLKANEDFSVKGLMSSLGLISLKVQAKTRTVEATIELPPQTKDYDIYLDLRLPDPQVIKKITHGTSLVEEIMGPTRLRFKKGVCGHVSVSCATGSSD